MQTNANECQQTHACIMCKRLIRAVSDPCRLLPPCAHMPTAVNHTHLTVSSFDWSCRSQQHAKRNTSAKQFQHTLPAPGCSSPPFDIRLLKVCCLSPQPGSPHQHSLRQPSPAPIASMHADRQQQPAALLLLQLCTLHDCCWLSLEDVQMLWLVLPAVGCTACRPRLTAQHAAAAAGAAACCCARPAGSC